MPARKPTSKSGIEHARLVARCCDLRVQGWSFTRIGQDVGWHPSTVSRAIAKATKEAATESAQVVVAMELERLDAMLEGLWPRATTGNVRAVEGVLQIMTRRAKFLGLDDFDKRMMELAERKQSLDQAQGALVFSLMNRVFDRLELTDAQRALLPQIVPGEIKALEAVAKDDD